MEKFPILVSYAYMRRLQASQIQWWITRSDIELFLDSGAYTAWSTGNPIKVEDYIEFLKRWGHGFWNYAALDVIAKPEATRENLYKMWNAGLKPTPVHVFGEGKDWMDYLFKQADFLALAVREQMGNPLTFINRVLKLRMSWAANRNVHWFGHVHIKNVSRYKPYSCDTSSWLRPARWGVMDLYLGKGKWGHNLKYSAIKGRALPADIIHAIQRYGYDPMKLYNPDVWRANTQKGIGRHDHLAYQISIASWVTYVREVKEKLGTRMFLAVNPGQGADTQSLLQHAGVEDTAMPGSKALGNCLGAKGDLK